MELALQDGRGGTSLIGLDWRRHAVASGLDEFTERGHIDPCRIGLVGVDVHLREGARAHTYQRSPEGEGAIIVGDGSTATTSRSVGS